MLPSQKAVRSKWVFKVGYHLDDSVTCYKARLVIQGFSQIYKIDFYKTFSPIVRRELLQIFLAISCLLKLIIEQVDIVAAYLDSLWDDNNLLIFMKIAPGIETF